MSQECPSPETPRVETLRLPVIFQVDPDNRGRALDVLAMHLVCLPLRRLVHLLRWEISCLFSTRFGGGNSNTSFCDDCGRVSRWHTSLVGGYTGRLTDAAHMVAYDHTF